MDLQTTTVQDLRETGLLYAWVIAIAALQFPHNLYHVLTAISTGFLLVRAFVRSCIEHIPGESLTPVENAR